MSPRYHVNLALVLITLLYFPVSPALPAVHAGSEVAPEPPIAAVSSTQVARVDAPGGPVRVAFQVEPDADQETSAHPDWLIFFPLALLAITAVAGLAVAAELFAQARRRD